MSVDGRPRAAQTTVVTATTDRHPTDGSSAIPTRVLILGMAHRDGTILADELNPVARACGQSPEQVRSALRRLVAEGLFVRASGSGAGARYEATLAGLATLGSTMERTRLAYAQDLAGRGWDRQWRLVAFAIPESRRRDRDALRDRLLALGGAAIQGGLYVSPHPWHTDVHADAVQLGLADAVSIATTDDLEVGGERDPRELARRLWPVDTMAARYAAFVDRYQHVPRVLAERRKERRRLADADFLPGALTMAVAFQECSGDDPLLPPELLPRPWPGRTARDLVAASRGLALSLRQSAGRPPLFRMFDEAIDQMPPAPAEGHVSGRAG
jgi:phenylacetic acid degradation operon negative regulatory protein